jgi:hypothetical protein
MKKTKIEDLKIGMKVTELSDGVKETILELTSSSVLITRTKRSKDGIYCNGWFRIEDFDKEFKI